MGGFFSGGMLIYYDMINGIFCLLFEFGMCVAFVCCVFVCLFLKVCGIFHS